MSDSILQEAEKIVHGDRGDSYGHPYDNFKQTAELWSAILGVPVSIKQVGLCMVAVKISRECHAPKRDNLVDIAGYAETICMALEKEREKDKPDGSPDDWSWVTPTGLGRPTVGFAT